MWHHDYKSMQIIQSVKQSFAVILVIVFYPVAICLAFLLSVLQKQTDNREQVISVDNRDVLESKFLFCVFLG